MNESRSPVQTLRNKIGWVIRTLACLSLAMRHISRLHVCVCRRQRRLGVLSTVEHPGKNNLGRVGATYEAKWKVKYERTNIQG